MWEAGALQDSVFRGGSLRGRVFPGGSLGTRGVDIKDTGGESLGTRVVGVREAGALVALGSQAGAWEPGLWWFGRWEPLEALGSQAGAWEPGLWLGDFGGVYRPRR